MRVAIPHELSREDVRERLRSRSHQIADAIPGGMADVTTRWESEDRLALVLGVMGQEIHGAIIAEEKELIFEVQLPAALSFIQPIIEKSVRENGTKLLK